MIHNIGIIKKFLQINCILFKNTISTRLKIAYKIIAVDFIRYYLFKIIKYQLDEEVLK